MVGDLIKTVPDRSVKIIVANYYCSAHHGALDKMMSYPHYSPI